MALSPTGVPAWQGICANRVAVGKYGIKNIADLSNPKKAAIVKEPCFVSRRGLPTPILGDQGGGRYPTNVLIYWEFSLLIGDGGEGGIRTPDTLASMPHFECGAFDHSATSPSL